MKKISFFILILLLAGFVLGTPTAKSSNLFMFTLFPSGAIVSVTFDSGSGKGCYLNGSSWPVVQGSGTGGTIIVTTNNLCYPGNGEITGISLVLPGLFYEVGPATAGEYDPPVLIALTITEVR